MAVKIFFCYAREDEALLNKLKSHLKPLQRQELIDVWHDRDISAGAEWEREVNKHLNTAQIILLLVSPDFMASDYAYSIEMKRALERHNRGEAYVIPVILRPVYWQGLLGNLQALPKDAIPVTDPDWHNLDRAFFDVAEGIHKVVKNILSQASSEYIAFEQIIPTKDQWWTNSAIGGIYVPIGYKSGTTNQQILELGKNIYQHALVVGNDFNKNALLHTFIMNLDYSIVRTN